jgi:hypothetical protein
MRGTGGSRGFHGVSGGPVRVSGVRDRGRGLRCRSLSRPGFGFPAGSPVTLQGEARG